MRWIVRIAAAIVGMFALALPIAGATAQASAQTISSTTSAHGICHYTVNGNGVAVHRAPDINAHVIKRKNLGDHVTGPCKYYTNGRSWTEVYLGSGGTGWMASAFLLYDGRW